MQWAFPERWSWLWILPVLIVGLVWAYRAQRQALERFAAPPLIVELTQRVHWERRRTKAICSTIGVGLLLLALVGPQWGFRWEEVTRRGVDLMIALDVSKSMLAEDVKPNRLTRATLAIQEIIPQLRGDRIGLVAFAGSSFLQCPLTVDYGAFASIVDSVSPDLIPRGGTTLAGAIGEGLNAFASAGEGSQALVLITDGEGHVGDPLAAARAAKAAGVTIFCIGIGTAEGELIPITDANGTRTYLKDREGRTVKSRLNEEVLTRIALETGGTYTRATATSFGLDVLYRERIAKMEQQEFDSALRKNHIHRFQWPLAAALLLLGVEPLIGDRRKRL